MRYLCALLLCIGAQNLLTNGSFENGTAHWEIFAKTKIVAGVCGERALWFDGTIHSETLHLDRTGTYRVTFWYRGKHLRSTVLMELPAAKTWTMQTYLIDGEYPVKLGFEGRGAIDCVTLTRVDNAAVTAP